MTVVCCTCYLLLMPPVWHVPCLAHWLSGQDRCGIVVLLATWRLVPCGVIEGHVLVAVRAAITLYFILELVQYWITSGIL